MDQFLKGVGRQLSQLLPGNNEVETGVRDTQQTMEIIKKPKVGFSTLLKDVVCGCKLWLSCVESTVSGEIVLFFARLQ